MQKLQDFISWTSISEILQDVREKLFEGANWSVPLEMELLAVTA
jgi:hypothetical protein